MHFTHYARELERNILESAQVDRRIRNYDPSSMVQCGTVLPLNNGITGQGVFGMIPPAPAGGVGAMGAVAPGVGVGGGFPAPAAPGAKVPGSWGSTIPGALGSMKKLGTGSLGPPASSFLRRPVRPQTGKRLVSSY